LFLYFLLIKSNYFRSQVTQPGGDVQVTSSSNPILNSDAVHAAFEPDEVEERALRARLREARESKERKARESREEVQL
jgi:hypothetical protein